MILSAEHITKSYPTADGPLLVLRDASLTIDRGELVSIMGPSGCGKSTLLNILGTLDKPDSGTLMIDNKMVSLLGDRDLSRLRNRTIGFVFQFHHLLPEFTILENLMIPQMVNGVGREESRARASDLLARVDLANRQGHKPGSISGGERQRVAVLRAIVNRPKLVLADEPTGNLDLETGGRLLEMIRQLAHVESRSFLIVTHNRAVAAECERNFLLSNGEVVAS